MRKLLRANFSRLWRNKLFWLGILLMMLAGIRNLAVNVSRSGYLDPNSLMFAAGMIISPIVAAFVGLFIGAEYSNGTIRNKIISGHSRCIIYLANWLVSITAASILHIAYLLVVAVGGAILRFGFIVKPTVSLVLSLVSVVSVITLCTVFLFFAMLIRNKSIAVVVLLLLSVSFIYYSDFYKSQLDTSEYIPVMWDENDDAVLLYKKNPDYPTGVRRQYYKVMYYALPNSQIKQIREMADTAAGKNKGYITEEQQKTLVRFCCGSALLILLCNGGGLLIFRKKDLT